MSQSRRELLEQLEGKRVLIVGDVMLDEYVFGDVQRISPDAPVPVVALGRREFHLGGAGNVASNVRALSGRPVLLGVVGDDEDGARLRRLTEERGVEQRLLVIPGRPTTRKTRVLARNQHVVRLDQETVQPLDTAAVQHLLGQMRELEKPDAIILSDYAKGVLTREVCRAVIDWARTQGVLVIVDPKSPDFRLYQGASFITPNTKETVTATRMPATTREEVVAAGRKLLADSEAQGILVTRSELGMALVTREDAQFIAAHKRNVFDVTGAGDTVIATFTLALAAGAAPAEAMALANRAAGIVVGKLGAASCTREELAREAGIDFRATGSTGSANGDTRLRSSRLLDLDEARQLAERWRAEGRRVVFTNGCFDILHAGHVVLLEEARSRGDALIVGLNTDASIKRQKGPTRPVQGLEDRARVLAALSSVDAVVAFEEDTPLNLVLALRPDVIVKGGDYSEDTIVGAKEVKSWGGEVAVIRLVAERSTTNILSRR